MDNCNIRYDGLKGERFTKLVVLSYSHKNKWGAKIYKCKCDCGEITFVNISHLRAGSTRSCGCLRKEIDYSKFITHGKTNTRLYTIWDGMIQRCNNKNDPWYHNYGGRGITVCAKWRKSFEVFHNDISVGYYQHVKEHGEGNTSIDRIDVNGNYEPDNVRWATRTMQSAYQRTSKLNTSGFKGVNFRKDRSKWRAFISKDGKWRHLGYFEDIEEAKKARLKAEIELYGELLPR